MNQRWDMKIDGIVHLINDNGKQYYIDSENFKIYYDSGLKDLAINDNPIVKTLVPLFSALTGSLSTVVGR